MSVIYTSDIDIPVSCFLCPFVLHRDPETDMCVLSKKTFESSFYLIEHRRDDCPLGCFPSHGPLIDADKLLAEMYRSFVELEDKAEKELGFDEVLRRGMQLCHAVCVDAVHAAPVVIPADPAPRFDYPGPRDVAADLPKEVKG